MQQRSGRRATNQAAYMWCVLSVTIAMGCTRGPEFEYRRSDQSQTLTVQLRRQPHQEVPARTL